MDHRQHHAGKGDRYRKVDKEKFDENIERIFGVKPIVNWNPDDEEEKEISETGKRRKNS